jgi:sugar/nucleoside kinase (ribokinase family)
MSLVVLGDVMVDVVVRVSEPLARGSDTAARVSFVGGGSGANVAAWAASLGTPVALACRVGNDERGRMAVDELLAAGVEVHAGRDRDHATGTCVVLVDSEGERTMLPDPGANDMPALVPDALLHAGGHLHVIGYALMRPGARPGALAAIERAHAAGMTVSVDPSSWALMRPGVFPDVDLLVPNEDEARVLGPLDAPEVVTKLGARGARWTDGRTTVEVPAEPVEVADTTGAGDAFAAGLLTARLEGAGPREALEAACRVAARAVAQVGARPGYD